MATKWNDLAKDEQQALPRVADHLSVSPSMMDRLRELGLIEEKRGGPGLSKAGRVLLSEHAASVQRSIRRR
jgi:ribosomal protein S19E (S16A)